MSLVILPLSAHETVAPRDHSWVQADENTPLFGQVTYQLGTWQIPPYNNIAITNDGNGNPIQYDYSLNGTIVATLSCTYDGNDYLTNIQQIL
jgi:hypothetical protein